MLERNYIAGRSSVNIAASIERALSHGSVAPGDLLPPVRDVAADLRVSPATVAAAYRMLRDRGIVIADGRRGTRFREAAPVARPATPLPRNVRDLATGNPDPRLMPVLPSVKPKQRLYRDTLNDPEVLRIARRQFDDDGVPAGEVAITSGALDGVERVLREHLRPGDRVIVEDPCFSGIADLLASLALTPVPVRVDDEGLAFDALRRALRRPPSALIATPRAQNPTGAALSPKRARQLRSLLKLHPDLLIVEDDHAGAIAGAAYHTLVAPSHRRWAVVRSMSKSLGPDLRIAFLTGDPLTIARVEGRQTLGMRWVSHVLQRIVVEVLKKPATARLLRRATETYDARRFALIDELARHGIAAHGASGLNAWIEVPDETAVVRGLLDRGWAVNPGDRYRIDTPPAIRVTTSDLELPDARRFASDLAALLAPRGRSSMV